MKSLRSCYTGFYGSKAIEQTNKISDKSRRILLVEATIDVRTNQYL